MGDGGRFAPDEPGAHPLFVDTSALYAYYYRRASQHEEMAAFFRELSRNDLPYRPLLTNRYVLDELVAHRQVTWLATEREKVEQRWPARSMAPP